MLFPSLPSLPGRSKIKKNVYKDFLQYIYLSVIHSILNLQRKCYFVISTGKYIRLILKLLPFSRTPRVLKKIGSNLQNILIGAFKINMIQTNDLKCCVSFRHSTTCNVSNLGETHGTECLNTAFFFAIQLFID